MKISMHRIFWGFVPAMFCFVAGYAYADSTVVSPQDFFAQVLAAVQSFGGLSMVLKVSAGITLAISSMKVSFLNNLIWSKLGPMQTWLAPVLGLVAGILGIGSNGQAMSLASVFAYLSAGAGAIVLHELLDSIKLIPGIGSAYVAIINVIEGAIGGPSANSIK